MENTVTREWRREIIVGFTPAGRTFTDKSGRLYIFVKDSICIEERDAYLTAPHP